MIIKQITINHYFCNDEKEYLELASKIESISDSVEYNMDTLQIVTVNNLGEINYAN